MNILNFISDLRYWGLTRKSSNRVVNFSALALHSHTERKALVKKSEFGFESEGKKKKR
jgi:hypothetical protein